MWWSPDLFQNFSFFKNIWKPVAASTFCSIIWALIYFYTNTHMGINFHTHLGILVGFIIGVRYSFGMMRMNQLLKSLSVLKQTINKMNCEIVLHIDNTHACNEIKGMILAYLSIKFLHLDSSCEIEQINSEVYHHSPEIIPCLILRKIKKNLDSVYLQNRCISHLSRIEAEIIELNCINDSNTITIGKIIFNWCNFIYMIFVGWSLTDRISFGGIPLTCLLAILFFAMNKLMDDLENPYESKVVNLSHHYQLFQKLANGVAEDKLEEYREDDDEIAVTVVN